MIVPWEKIEKYMYEDIETVMFLEVLNKHAPVKIIRPRKKQLPWIDDDIRKLMKWKLTLDAL